MKVRIELEVEWSEYSDDGHEITSNFMAAIQPDMEFWKVVKAGAQLKGEPLEVTLLKSAEI